MKKWVNYDGVMCHFETSNIGIPDTDWCPDYFKANEVIKWLEEKKEKLASIGRGAPGANLRIAKIKLLDELIKELSHDKN